MRIKKMSLFQLMLGKQGIFVINAFLCYKSDGKWEGGVQMSCNLFFHVTFMLYMYQTSVK